MPVSPTIGFVFDHVEEKMTASFVYMTTALAFASTLGIAGFAAAEEPMQVNGTTAGTKVESHFIPAAGDPNRGFGLNKWVSTSSSTTPGYFEWMHETDVESFQTDLKLGRSNVQGSFIWANTEGTEIGSYTGVAKFTIDEKTNAPKGTYEGTWEITGGTERFANVRGHGIDKAKFDGDSFFDNWSGTISGLERQ
jgi:hypothetical protein